MTFYNFDKINTNQFTGEFHDAESNVMSMKSAQFSTSQTNSNQVLVTAL
jgi:hypothetical protein